MFLSKVCSFLFRILQSIVCVRLFAQAAIAAMVHPGGPGGPPPALAAPLPMPEKKKTEKIKKKKRKKKEREKSEEIKMGR